MVNTVKLWHVGSGECVKTLSGHSNDVWSVSFSRDGTLLASGSMDKTVKLWHVGSGECVKTLPGHGEGVASVSFSPNGTLLLSGSHDTTVKLWQVSTGTETLPQELCTAIGRKDSVLEEQNTD
jgi:WD40 repeat protein